jgi:hypothetical protein
MTPIFKNAEIKFEDIGEYMQNYHNENNIPFNKGDKLIGSYFGKENLLYTRLRELEFVAVEFQYPTSTDSLHLARGNHVQRTASLGLCTQPIPDLHQ